MQELLLACVVLGAHALGTNNSSENTATSNPEGKAELSRICRESAAGNDRANIRFKQVGTHASNVADVVSHVISDDSWVSWVVFREASLNFANEVSSDISGFGVDTTSNASKEGNTGSTKTEPCEVLHSVFPFFDVPCVFFVKDHQTKHHDNPSNAKSNNGETHDGTASKSNLQGRVHAASSSSMSGTHVGVRGDDHTKPSSGGG
mmetsp:Transcript_16804/g.32762  ORF Transcript_16804/g.32762 Transcript_16804/m.32762 type:complete len:205 (-) Transcript_16804:385-999(-)